MAQPKKPEYSYPRPPKPKPSPPPMRPPLFGQGPDGKQGKPVPPEPGWKPPNGEWGGQYIINQTGELYQGWVLEWMGRLVSTMGGTYEGYFSKTLIPAPQGTLPQGNGKGKNGKLRQLYPGDTTPG